MPVCSQCGNDYLKTFDITLNNHTFTFDCFECAIHMLAPSCENCHGKIIGHGIEANNHFYCCAHCARHEGVQDARDHV